MKALPLVLALIALPSLFAEMPTSAVPRMFFSPMPDIEPPIGLEILFNPRDNIEARIIQAIDASKTEVLVNHYIITNPRIFEALARAFARKCMVVVALDAAPAVPQYVGFDMLARYHIPTVSLTRKPGQWSNSKYIILDRATVLVGTGDLSRSATRNDESLLILQEPSAVSKFYNHFISTIFPK